MSRGASVRFRRENGTLLPLQARRCDTFLCRLQGLMFRRSLDPEEGLLFVEGQESRMAATIHMWFVFFPIAVIWLDSTYRVVDKVLARPFRPFYAPRVPAQYYIEGPPALLELVEVGERLSPETDAAH